MMSILIPVFNQDVNELVHELSHQVAKLQEPAEIIVMDDGSEVSYRHLHTNLNDIPFVRYYESGTNNGRVSIRQLLCELASSEWLLFLDGDSRIVSDQYLANYSRLINYPDHVWVGGRIYAGERPADCSLRLHWHYGTAREKTKPGLEGYTNRFMSNNFLMRKSIFQQFDFTTKWTGYGYEDTWMGIQLESMQIIIHYIHNPVLHEGIEKISAFLAKSHEALGNLSMLSTIVPRKILVKHVKLYFYFSRLQSFGLLSITQMIYDMFSSFIKTNLHSCHPSLFMFDLYRLIYFSRIKGNRR